MHRWVGGFLAPVIASFIFIACAQEETNSDAVCIPDRANWDEVVQDVVATHCGLCHGERPDFSAPYSLTDYDKLIEGVAGHRPVDKIVSLLKSNAMPPAPIPKPKHADFDTMILWASCGLDHPDYQDGLQSSAPIFRPEGEVDEGTTTWDVTAGGFSVKSNYIDRYQCFMVDVPVTETSLIRRVEMIIDDSRVLHHVVLYRDTDRKFDNRDTFKCTGTPGSSDFLYGWAPGQDAIQFEKGGLVVEPGERYILQIHYNNAAGIQNIKDDSGVRIFYEPKTEDVPAYSMFVPGPNLFMISPQSSLSVTGHCEIEEEMTLMAGMPHMHEIGRDFSSEVIRADGSVESIIDLAGWSFEAQLFYKYDIKLYPGDTLKTTCLFYNDSETDMVFFGAKTNDEMCFNFAYVTPPLDRRFCNDSQSFEE